MHCGRDVLHRCELAVVFYLETERVEDHLINSCGIEVEDGEPEVLKSGDHFQKLLWPPLREDLQVGMAFDHCHLDVGHCGLVLGHGIDCIAVTGGGGNGGSTGAGDMRGV